MASIARRYARALFDQAQSEDRQRAQRYGTLLAAFTKSVSTDPEVQAFLYSPHNTRAQRMSALAELFSDPGDASFLSFLTLLVEKNRFHSLADISAEYERILLEDAKILNAVIETPFPLDDSMIDKITSVFRKKTGASEIRPEIRIVPELLGGIRVSLGGMVLDGTVRSNLDRLLQYIDE